ncbi:MAG: SsrA-binding protein SmpB [Patescibacteria group bacterium]|nr:SsrA-binding protein SmpB [Patescibacteria group bacterium]
MKPLINRKARFHYNILEEIEAGIALLGREVKSIKTGQADISAAYVSIGSKAGPVLVGASIPLYKFSAPDENYDPLRTRKLLLKKKEIISLEQALKQKGLTLIATKVYTKRGRVKVKIALAKGKTKIDKRQKIREREEQRSIKNRLKQRTGSVRYR